MAMSNLIFAEILKGNIFSTVLARPSDIEIHSAANYIVKP